MADNTKPINGPDGQWIDNQPLGDYGLDGNGFLHILVYPDGRKIIEVYKYGVEGAIKTIETSDPQAATAAQRQQDQSEKQIASRVLENHPTTGRPAWHITYRDGSESWDEASVPAAATRETAKGTKTTIENGEKVTREIEADGSPGRITNQVPASKAEIDQATGATQNAKGSNREPVPGKPGIYKVTTATKTGGDETKETHYEDEQGNRVPTPVDEKEPKEPSRLQDPETKQWLEKQPDGTWKPIQIQGTERAPIPTTGDIQGQIGELVPNAIKKRDALTEIYNAGGISKADYEKQAKQIMEDANSRYTELNGLLSAQNTITGQQAGQRRDTISQANTATTFANNALERTMKLATSPPAGIYGPNAGETAIRGIKGFLSMHNEALKNTPGFSVPPPIQPTPFQQSVLTINPTAGTITVGMGGSGGSAGGVDASNIGSALSGGLGAGVGPSGESLTRPGADASTPDYGSMMQEYMDPEDDDWNQAVMRQGQELGIA